MAVAELLKLEDMNVIKINNKVELLKVDPELYDLREKTFINDWKKTIAEYDKYLQDCRCFIIYRPKIRFVMGDIAKEHFDTFMTISTKDETECMSMLQNYLGARAVHSASSEPNIEKGGYKTTPIQSIKVLELDSLLFLETAATACIMGYPVGFISIINNPETRTIFPAATYNQEYKNYDFKKKRPLNWESTIQNKIYPRVLRKFYDQRREKNNKTVK